LTNSVAVQEPAVRRPAAAVHHDHLHKEHGAHPGAHEPHTPRRRRNSGRRGRGAGDGVSLSERPTSGLPAAKAPISEAFRALGLDDTALNAIAALGYTEPTPIQSAALPRMLDGEDLIGLAQTGTG
jgi:hypothetical protein